MMPPKPESQTSHPVAEASHRCNISVKYSSGPLYIGIGAEVLLGLPKGLHWSDFVQTQGNTPKGQLLMTWTASETTELPATQTVQLHYLGEQEPCPSYIC